MNIKKFKYKRVKSTNDTAINIIRKKNIKSGMVIAENQKKGRGQMGKKWISYKGNLFVTIFYSLEKIDLTLRELTKENVNLVIKLISYYYKKKIKLKLPNDILINRRKICGILQEKVQKNGINYLIVGIGLNLVKSPNIKEYPTTNLYELTKKKLNTEKVSKQLMLIYINFFKSKGFF